jgi:hypothetical protein
MFYVGQKVKIMTETECIKKFDRTPVSYDNSYNLIFDNDSRYYITNDDKKLLFGKEFIIEKIYKESSTRIDYCLLNGYEFAVPLQIIQPGKKNNLDW